MKDIAQYIDHTLLKPAAMTTEILQLCREAVEHGFASVCVNSGWVWACRQYLDGFGLARTPKVCSVVGFPLGAMSTKAKVAETMHAISEGADEIDMVINVGRLKERDHAVVLGDIAAVVAAAKQCSIDDERDNPVIVNVIIETFLLTDEEKRIACELAVQAGAHFVKTCSGMNGGGATEEDVALMKSIVGDAAEVKASALIRDYPTAKAMINAGATRLGTSSGVAIVTGAKSQAAY